MSIKVSPTADFQAANLPRASFIRRLGAIIYDLLLALGIYIFCGAFGFLLFLGLVSAGILPDGGQSDIAALLQQNPIYQNGYQAYLAFCVLSFYAFFWKRAGQTLGMRAWRLRVQHPNGQGLSWSTAYIRVIGAGLGLGNLYMLLGRDRLALQDKITQTEVVVYPKPETQTTH